MEGKGQERSEIVALRRDLVRLRSYAVAVRLAQVRYFATRDKQDLIASKSAETKLDVELFGKSLNRKDVEKLYNESARNVPNGSTTEGINDGNSPGVPVSGGDTKDV
jgi:hypothetical protein